MQKLTKFTLLLFAAGSFMMSVSAQVVPIAVADIVRNADSQRLAYTTEFRNLLTEETKTIEDFGKNGEIKRQRKIKSIFVIYQLSKDENQIAEYRNVVSIDGKPVERTDQRAQDFFEKIAGVESTAKELQRIRDESSRFDGDLSIDGFTLFQAAPLAENLRPSFEFTLEGEESIDGSVTYRVAYKQIRDSPFILINAKEDGSPGKLILNYFADLKDSGNLNQRLSGKLWIDAVTFQTRRELRVLTVKPKDFAGAVTLAENTFDYGNSDFGILTPRKITYTENRILKDKPVSKEIRVTFEYDKFTKPDVDVKSDEVK